MIFGIPNIKPFQIFTPKIFETLKFQRTPKISSKSIKKIPLKNIQKFENILKSINFASYPEKFVKIEILNLNSV